MQENFKILGISENASTEEIESAYKSLRDKYQKDRFLEGEAGNEAAKNLTKVENAYREIMDARSREKSDGESFSKDYSKVEALIKAGDINEAQKELDFYEERDAEWHYLQSVVFYKKNWINESKKQLEIAVDMSPSCEKYSLAYKKLNEQAERANKQHFHSGNASNLNNQQNNRQMGGDSCGGCAECCTTWCCMELLCNGCCR